MLEEAKKICEEIVQLVKESKDERLIDEKLTLMV